MSGFALRRAQPTDAGKLGGIITEAVAAHDWKPQLHSAAEDIAFAGRMIDRGWVTVALDDSLRLGGFLARDKDYVHCLFVARFAQGAGIGKQLLDAAKAQSARLELWTFERNRGAQRFYKREGFREIERSDGAKNEEGLPDIHYLWEKHA